MSATARYAWNQWAGRAHVQAGVAHQSSASVDLRQNIDGAGFNPNDVLGRLKSSTLIDLFAGYDWGKYSVELYSTNIFDQRNQLSRFVVCGDHCLRPEVVHIVPGRPRTIGIRVGAKF
jgi:outer membrane receptor protein involved in Fe transport